MKSFPKTSDPSFDYIGTPVKEVFFKLKTSLKGLSEKEAKTLFVREFGYD